MVIQVVYAIEATPTDMEYWTEFLHRLEKQYALTQGVVLVCYLMLIELIIAGEDSRWLAQQALAARG
jgi:hypothetical protein